MPLCTSCKLSAVGPKCVQTKEERKASLIARLEERKASFIARLEEHAATSACENGDHTVAFPYTCFLYAMRYALNYPNNNYMQNEKPDPFHPHILNAKTKEIADDTAWVEFFNIFSGGYISITGPGATTVANSVPKAKLNKVTMFTTSGVNFSEASEVALLTNAVSKLSRAHTIDIGGSGWCEAAEDILKNVSTQARKDKGSVKIVTSNVPPEVQSSGTLQRLVSPVQEDTSWVGSITIHGLGNSHGISDDRKNTIAFFCIY